MSKEDKVGFDTNWYDLWMKQSKEFFESANTNLKDVFDKHTVPNPEEHLKQIQQWLDTMKSQWQFMQLTNEQKAYQDYWQTMSKMCNDAADMMLKEWIKRSRNDHPIENIRELYELWLHCCHEIYQQSLQSKAYQDTYGEFMNAAFKYWKSVIPK